MADSKTSNASVYPSLLPDAPTTGDNRDPNGINKHFQLDFFNVIGEPDASAHNFELLHDISRKVYQYTKLFIYRLLTILFGLPLMICWGLILGCYTFLMVWIATPARRLWQSLIAETGLYIQTISDAVVGPLYSSFGQIFSRVRINLINGKGNTTQQNQV